MSANNDQILINNEVINARDLGLLKGGSTTKC